MEPATIGVADGAQGGESSPEPAITSVPDASPPASEPASQPSLDPTAAEQSGETPEAAPPPGEAYAAWLASQPPEVVRAEHARLAKIPAYDETFNRDRSARDNAARTKIAEDMRLQAEHRSVMEKNSNWLDGLVKNNPAAAAAAAYDDNAARQVSGGQLDAAGFRQTQNDIATWRANQSEAPTRAKIANEVADRTLVGIRDLLAADPEWEGVAGKLSDISKVEGQGPEAVSEFIVRLAKARVDAMLPTIRKEEQTKAEAKFQANTANEVDGAVRPDLVTAGITGGAGNNLRTEADVYRALGSNEITTTQARARIADLQRAAFAAR